MPDKAFPLSMNPVITRIIDDAKHRDLFRNIAELASRIGMSEQQIYQRMASRPNAAWSFDQIVRLAESFYACGARDLVDRIANQVMPGLDLTVRGAIFTPFESSGDPVIDSIHALSEFTRMMEDVAAANLDGIDDAEFDRIAASADAVQRHVTTITDGIKRRRVA